MANPENPEGRPRFSVVVPAYNSGRMIEPTIRSVLAQSRSSLELIVVDDGSSDDTANVVERLAAEDSRIRLIRQANAGTAGARNTGVEHARGELVGLLDHDDLWLPHYLAYAAEALASTPQASFSFTDAWLFNAARGRFRRRTALQFYPPVPDVLDAEDLLRRLIRHNFVMSSVLVRRAALIEVGGFDPAIRGVDDWDLWIRIAAAGGGAVRAQGCELVQRDHPASQSKDLAMMHRGISAVLRRVVDRYEVSEGTRELARTELEANERLVAALSGERALAGRVLRFKGWAVGIRERVRGEWRAYPPESVRSGLPEFAAGTAGRTASPAA